MNEKRILLIIGGGIAAYKSLELIRELSRRGIASRCIVTKGGAEFVTPLSVSALSGEKCFTDLFDLDDEAEMGHIQLSRSADLVVVCPATADLMAKAAGGLANDLASTALLATDKPVLMVPAMNVRMWQHAATQRNVETLRDDGVTVMDPDDGAMACGEFGPGRLPEPLVIADQIEAMLHGSGEVVSMGAGRLAGRHALITAGPTREPLDPVRFLSNHSSGKQGYAIAEALAAAGARVTLVSGPVSLPTPRGVDLIPVETAREMLAACEAALPADVFVSVAAVADWRPSRAAAKKMKLKEGDDRPLPTLELSENPDILATLSRKKKNRPTLVIGFAAETHDVEDLARAKLKRKRCDWIVANDVSGDVMGGADNEVALVTRDSLERWPRMDKAKVAARLADRIYEAFKNDVSETVAAE
ncbi:MAG: bifunctional phosphopantothenoylcysteine decarboxylase/phosphopantothenate--cysteine ligase CoaBC [Pseudomonadota bacterium]